MVKHTDSEDSNDPYLLTPSISLALEVEAREAT
jgi:hypothetical protein